ncbi:hypothetical protein ACD591_15100 [Rufibacter glacialis]|uniref:Glycosyltransferase RgtA/B/C/D-like domain-containing protein n=1 Tax=Rufibacter glacialis TaxID=1259555 RepID=A0A5M8QRP2_9BACT|nr:hypothetical protein [Rufibacter glacialis]KAA6437720.1 hypothetical protein FOE74_04235 [Rufibacter glacialis]GGK56894.1 hypothetical protein GCM10011405_01270 [Rufibacter glacialis]
MRESSKLLLLFLAISLVILVRVALEPDGYTTPDSNHYMKGAGGLLTTGDLTYTIGGKTSTFTIWPLGYSFSIATVAYLSPFSLLWNSKLVNLLWIALTFLLLRRLYPENAFWIGLVFCMHSILDIFSFTWSEPGFMVIMLWYSVALHHFLFKPDQRTEWAFHLVFAIIGAFLYRYFGAYLLGVLSLFGVYFLWKRKWKEVGLLIGVAAGVVGFILSYFWFVQQHTGYYSGTTRIPADESFLYLLQNLAQTQLNEFLLIRKLPFHQVDYLAILFLVLQLGVLLLVVQRIRKSTSWKETLAPKALDSLPLTIAFVGGTYWLTMVVLRFFMKFDMFDFRLITPATFLFLVAGHAYLAATHRRLLLQKIQKPIVFLYFVALAHGLYKKQLLLLFLNG